MNQNSTPCNTGDQWPRMVSPKTFSSTMNELYKDTRINLWAATCGSDGKESACNIGDPGSISGLGRPPGGGILAWRIPGTEDPGGIQSRRVTKSQTRLSDGARTQKDLWRKQNQAGIRFLSRHSMKDSGATPTGSCRKEIVSQKYMASLRIHEGKWFQDPHSH